MDMNEAQRIDLAARLLRVRNKQYGGKRNRIYGAININSMTWKRVEEAKPVKESTVVAIMNTIWPETDGDWRNMVPPLGAGAQSEPPPASREAG